VRVLPGSPLVGQTLGASLIGSQLGVAVMAIWSGRTARIAPAPDEVIAADDLLLVLGREERVSQLAALGARLGRNGHGPQALRTLAVYLCEVLIGPRASAIGQTLKSLRLRSRFGVTAVALWREGRSYRTDVGDFVLEPGDALLVVGGPEALHSLAAEPGLITPDQPQEPPPPPERARWAVGITLAALFLSATAALPTAEVLLAGGALLVQTGCLSMEDAYRAIEWRVVVLIAGLLPIGTALTESGLAAQIGQALAGSLASAGPLALLAALYLLTVALTQVVGGQVAALLVGPVAVSAAVQLQVNPQAVGVAVAMACSAAFLTPVAHPVNLLMLGPGGYTFGDFLRVGSGLALVCFLTLLATMPLLWPL
jgi:di/tricarboxylate transporter